MEQLDHLCRRRYRFAVEEAETKYVLPPIHCRSVVCNLLQLHIDLIFQVRWQCKLY